MLNAGLRSEWQFVAHASMVAPSSLKAAWRRRDRSRWTSVLIMMVLVAIRPGASVQAAPLSDSPPTVIGPARTSPSDMRAPHPVAPAMTEAWPSALAPLKPSFQLLCRHSPTVVSLQSQVELAADRSALAQKWYWPRLSADAGASVSDAGSGGGALNSNFASLRADLNLPALFSPWTEARRAQLEHERTKWQNRLELQRLGVNVIDQVLIASSFASRDQDLAENEEQLQRQFRILSGSVRQGLARQRDQQKFEAEILKLRETRLNLKRAQREALERLKVLLGEELPPESLALSWKSMASLEPPSLVGMKTSPSLEVARLKWDVAQLNEKLQRQRTGLVTQVSASYGIRRSPLDSASASDQVRSLSASVNFSLPILDWGSDALQRREAIEAKSVAEREWQEAERSFIAERDLLIDEGERLRERRKLAQRLYELERKSFQQIVVDYREGRTTYLDWLSASQTLRASVQSQIELANEWARHWLRVQSFRGDLAHEICP